MASTRVVMIRMNKEVASQFGLLSAEYQALPPSTLARLLLTATLALPLDQQLRIIQSQLKKPGSQPPYRFPQD